MDIPVFILTSSAEGATLPWGVFPGIQEAKDRAEEVSLHGLSWRIEVPDGEVRPVCRADFDDVAWRVEEFTLVTGSPRADAAILMAARAILKTRFGLFTQHEQKALASAADRISPPHDHSWAADPEEARANCPDLNPAVAALGIPCPGDPASGSPG